MDRKQLERQQRGAAFQEELRRSWRKVPNCWRMRISDGRGGTRPADDIVILKDINILAELKRTASLKFELGYLEPNQLKGLLDFEKVTPRNFGLVFVSFNNEATDEAVTFRLIDALHYMKEAKRKYITLDEFRAKALPCVTLPRISILDKPGYDLREVGSYFTNKYLE